MTARPDNQRQIIRQSQIKLALEYYGACDICPTMLDLIRTTTMLEDFVVNGYSKDMVAKFEKLDIHIQTEYKKP
jgi:hypothetical protein